MSIPKFDARTNYSGQQFCHLLAIKPIESSISVDGRISMYECECTKCGKHITVWADQMFNYVVRSCGCTPRDDLVGGVFDRLKVLSLDHETQNERGRRERWYRCECSCNKRSVLVTNSRYLISRHRRSCGCLRQEQLKDLSGCKFGLLTAVYPIVVPGQPRRWFCVCDCGGNTGYRGVSTPTTPELLSGGVHSCGCLAKFKLQFYSDEERQLAKRLTTMKKRCYCKTSQDYPRYGGRGIYICDEWLKNKWAFIQWGLENGFKYGLEIDRIDNDGPYSPENCRWVTRQDQMNNMSRNRMLTIDGTTDSVSNWARTAGVQCLPKFTVWAAEHSDDQVISRIKQLFKQRKDQQNDAHRSNKATGGSSPQ